MIKDHHIRPIPEDLPVGVYAIRLAILRDKHIEPEKMESYDWISLGSIANYENRIKPIPVGNN